jgi:hypothetical protein
MLFNTNNLQITSLVFVTFSSLTSRYWKVLWGVLWAVANLATMHEQMNPCENEPCRRRQAAGTTWPGVRLYFANAQVGLGP